MAESSARESKDYGKNTQKFLNRTIEKMMHTLGKSDKTSDEDFDKLAQRFNEQQGSAVRLQKEFKAYMTQAKAMMGASQNLYSAMKDLYESDWERSQEFRDNAEKLQVIESTRLNELDERVLAQLTSYTSQFAQVKERMSKRSRKLVDYDAARHSVQSLENSKKRNDFKITQAHSELVAARNVYENLNQDLQRELPRLYDSRVASLCACFDALLSTELKFDTECSEIKKEMAEIASRTCTRAPEVAVSSLSTSSSDRQVNNYVSHSDMKSFQRLSTPDEVFKQPVLTGVSTVNGNTSKQISYASSASVYSDIDDEDIKVKLKTKSDPEKDPGVSYVIHKQKSTTGVSQYSSNSLPSPTAENLTNGISVENGGPSQFSSLDIQEVSRSSSETSQQKQTMSSPSLHNNEQLNDDDNDDDDSFNEQMIKMKQQQEVQRQQQQELIRQQELANDREMISDQTKLAVHHSFTKHEEVRVYGNIEQDASTSFLSPQPLTSDFFASKKNAMAQSKDIVLYSVVATNPYDAADDEELDLAAGHVITVVQASECDEPLDDGWLIGFNTATGMRGLFPENFTKKL